MKRVSYLICALLLFCFFTSCNDRERRLIKKGNDLVNKVELYKKNKGKLPASLSDLGIKETEEGPLYYQKRDSLGYKIWFGTSLGESETYYSDSKKWEDHQR
jgi:hypothetical protein